MSEEFAFAALCILGILLIWAVWEATARRRRRQEQEALHRKRAIARGEMGAAPPSHTKTAHVLRVHSLYSCKYTGLFTTPYANNKSQHSFQHGWSSGCVVVTAKKGNVSTTEEPLKGSSKPKRCVKAKIHPSSFPTLSSSPNSLKPLTRTLSSSSPESSGPPLTSPGAKRKSVVVPAPSPILSRKAPPKKSQPLGSKPKRTPGQDGGTKKLSSPMLLKTLPSGLKAPSKLPPSPNMLRGPKADGVKPLKALKKSPGLPRKLPGKSPVLGRKPLMKLPKKA